MGWTRVWAAADAAPSRKPERMATGVFRIVNNVARRAPVVTAKGSLAFRPSRMGCIDTEVTSLDLAIIGNGRIAALIDASGSIVWCCLPRFDGDPVFCSLLEGGNPGSPGAFAITLEGGVRIE